MYETNTKCELCIFFRYRPTNKLALAKSREGPYMRRSTSLAGGFPLPQTLRGSTGCQRACAWLTFIPGREAMSTGAGEMHLRLPFDGQSEEALASSTQLDRDREKGRFQGSGVTSCFFPEASGCMEACLFPAIFPHRTSHKLLRSAPAEASREQSCYTASRDSRFGSCFSVTGPCYC